VKKTYTILLVLAFVLAACTSSADMTTEPVMEKPTEAMLEKTTEVMMEKATEEVMVKPTEAMMENSTAISEAMTDKMIDVPAWFSAEFTDASTGEVFTIGDYAGKVVLVETLAMWCPTCKRQQMQVVELHKLLGEREDFISVGLDIDINENLADLKNYVESNGFDWKYSVAESETAHEIGQLYGDQFLNPPSAPMLIIDRKGEVHPLPFGVKTADDLMKALEPFLNEGM
jgi:thiol-disulfide isomerase/thioredoxin